MTTSSTDAQLATVDSADAATVDLVVQKVVPAATVVHKDMHRLTWAKCSTSSTKIAMVR